MRTYEQTHPWLSFRWEPRRMPYPVWLLLGEAVALVRTIRQAALPGSSAAELDRLALVRGLHALAALEGNTLSEEQVIGCLDTRLKLPASQAYLGQEIQNLLKAVRWTEDRLRGGDKQFSPWSLQLLNAQVLKGLPWDEENSPGDYRSARQHSAQGGAPAEDIGYLVERLCDWLRAERFTPEHAEETQAFGLVRALLAQLYLLWIRPFSDGNARTAWLVTAQLLLEAGLPVLAVHHLVAHTGRVRNAWVREISAAGSGHGDPIPFIAFMARGLVEALRELAIEVEGAQQRAILGGHLHQLFTADRSANGARRMKLLMALTDRKDPVPPGRLAHLSPELAGIYARLDRKTLLRDIQHLQEQGLLERLTEGFRPVDAPLRAFKALVPD
jgi:Fic family protein